MLWCLVVCCKCFFVDLFVAGGGARRYWVLYVRPVSLLEAFRLFLLHVVSSRAACRSIVSYKSCIVLVLVLLDLAEVVAGDHHVS